jgi:DNA-directed RNA polymerase subunit RPC12/RpoP
LFHFVAVFFEILYSQLRQRRRWLFLCIFFSVHFSSSDIKGYLVVCGKGFRIGEGMKSFLVVVCGKCGGFLLAEAGQKTRTCPYCGSKVFLEKAKKVASTSNIHEASMILRKLKRDAVLKRNDLKLR